MTQPWLGFVVITLGLIQGGGVEVLGAPVRWVTTGVEARQQVQPALACAVAAMQERGP